MKPKPSSNKKIVVAVIVAVAILVCAIVAMFAAFSRPKSPETPAIDPNMQITDTQAPSDTTKPEKPEEPSKTPDEPPMETEPLDEADDEENFPKEDKDDSESEEFPLESKDPSQKEDSENKDGSSAESPAPAETHKPVEPAKPVVTVDKIWNGIANTMSDGIVANMTLSGQNLQELYGIDPNTCDEFVLRKSGTIMTPEEYLIIKGSAECLTNVEQACQQRQMALVESWGNGNKSGEMLKNYQISRIGDFLFFGISPNINQYVGIFQGMMIVS